MEFQLPNIDGEELTIAAIQEVMETGKYFCWNVFSEETLIKIGYAFEQATKFRKPPSLIKKV